LGEKAEVWEAGAVAYELLVGQPPTAVPAAPPTGLVRQGSFLGFLGFLSDDCFDFLQAVSHTFVFILLQCALFQYTSSICHATSSIIGGFMLGLPSTPTFRTLLEWRTNCSCCLLSGPPILPL